MFQAIQVKYLPYTNTQPSRLKAFCQAGSVTVGYDSPQLDAATNQDAKFRMVAEMLCEKLGWVSEQGNAYGELVGGWLPNNVAVFVMPRK